MAATATSVSNYFFEAKPLWTGAVAAGGVASDTAQTIPLAAATDLDNGDAYIVRINRVNQNGVKQAAGDTEVTIGVLSGTNLINCTREVEGAAQAWGAGTVIEILFTATHWNKLIEGLGVSHNADGTMISSLPLTTPKITTSINDANGNEVIKTPATASAVNEITVTNAATGDAPKIEATGGDTNIDLKLLSKGTGALTVSGTTDYENNVTDDDDIPNKKYVDDHSTSSYTDLYSNALINPLFDVWQSLNAGSSVTPNDDVYVADIWNALTETNAAWTYSKSTDAPTGFGNSLKCVSAIANNQMALVQFIDNANTKNLAGQTVSLSFYAKTTTAKTIANLRATVLAWNSTADSITSDVIGTWAQDGTDPTFAANWTKEIAGSNQALTTSWQRFTITGIALDTASTANLAVVVWVDDGTIAANDEFYITAVQLNVGSSATLFSPRPFDYELRMVQKFYEQSWRHGAAQANSEMSHVSNVNGYIFVYPSVRKRVAMSTSNVAIYDGTTLNQVRNTNTGGTVGSLTFDGVGVAGDKMAALYDLSAFTANTAYDYNWIIDQRL